VTFHFDLALHLFAAVLLSFAENKVPECFSKEMGEGKKKHNLTNN